MQRSVAHNRRTLDPLLAKCYFYHSRAYELVGRLKEIRRYFKKKINYTNFILHNLNSQDDSSLISVNWSILSK